MDEPAVTFDLRCVANSTIVYLAHDVDWICDEFEYDISFASLADDLPAEVQEEWEMEAIMYIMSYLLWWDDDLHIEPLLDRNNVPYFIEVVREVIYSFYYENRPDLARYDGQLMSPAETALRCLRDVGFLCNFLRHRLLADQPTWARRPHFLLPSIYTDSDVGVELAQRCRDRWRPNICPINWLRFRDFQQLMSHDLLEAMPRGLGHKYGYDGFCEDCGRNAWCCTRAEVTTAVQRHQSRVMGEMISLISHHKLPVWLQPKRPAAIENVTVSLMPRPKIAERSTADHNDAYQVREQLHQRQEQLRDQELNALWKPQHLPSSPSVRSPMPSPALGPQTPQSKMHIRHLEMLQRFERLKKESLTASVAAWQEHRLGTPVESQTRMSDDRSWQHTNMPPSGPLPSPQMR
eukprot:TRINITY_DN3819_c0_g1_i1.p1 TRINITY_DN3819_c0_g1~~TRINITY_DN3819_c0_g1_i1.p1  ORF type:complete len:406 (+),score=55.37 TRINITY_DN3819_c0_g1_i1:12-1229(+)